MTTNRGWQIVLMGLGLLLGSVGSSAAADASLYELMENMTLGVEGGLVKRLAVAALQGTANPGTPFCPDPSIATRGRCTVTATGGDDVAVSSGLGTVWADGSTVVQGDNPTDGPEYVVSTWHFKGVVDLSYAVKGVAPLGYLSGQITVDGVLGVFPVTGTFRLPFTIDKATGKRVRPQRNRNAYYLGDDFQPVPVRLEELSLGWPSVRLDLTFTK